MAITLLGNSIETPHLLATGATGTIETPYLLVEKGSNTGGTLSSQLNLTGVTNLCQRQVSVSTNCTVHTGTMNQINASRDTENDVSYSSSWGYGDTGTFSVNNQTIRLESVGGHAFFKGKVRIGEDSIASPSGQDYGLVVVGGSDTGGSVSSSSNLNGITTSCTKQINVSNNCSLPGGYSQVNASENCEISSWRGQINSSDRCKLDAGFSQINCSSLVVNETSYSTAWGYVVSGTASVNNQTIRLESVGGHAFFKGKVRIGEDSIVSPGSQSQPLKINGGICQKYAVGDDNIFYNKLDPSDIFSPTNDFINGVNIRRVVRIRDVTDTNFLKSIMRSIPKNKTMTISISVSMVRVLSSDSGQTDTDDYYEGVFIYSSYFDGVDHGFKTKTVVKTPSSLSSVSFVVYSIGYDYNEIDMEFSGVTAGVTLDYMAVVDITISGRTQV